MLYVTIPYADLLANVESGLKVPPPDFVQQVVAYLRIQLAVAILLDVATFSVKFSFLFLFKGLISRVRHLTSWWWCVFVLLVPSTILYAFIIFLACSNFGIGAVGELKPVRTILYPA